MGFKRYKLIDLNLIANHFSFSPSYLTKIFVKHTNITPSKYIVNYHINIAKQLLGDFSLTINMVAIWLGIQTISFCKTFKRIAGVSPVGYSEELSKNKLEDN